MIVLVKGPCEEMSGTMEIADGDSVTPQLLKAQGCRFPIAVMRFTFKNGPYYSASNGAALVTVERNDDWPERWRP